MRQAIMTSPGIIDIHETATPAPGEQDVLVRIMRIGICGSDIHVYHGLHPFTSYPVVQGHEVSGFVSQVGDKVSGLKIGDAVTIQPQVTCGQCYACKHGNYHICDQLKVMGFQTTGTASDYFAVNAAKIIKLPEGFSFDEGAMVEPLAVAVHALRRAGDVSGMKILVLGSGTIGNLVAQAAKGLGAQAVMITDLSAYRLAKAAECGIDFTINTGAGGKDLETAILEAFGPERADLILECVGANATMDQAVAQARKGTDIIVVGVFGRKPAVDLGLVQDRELRLIGTLMYQEQDYREAIRLLNEGKVNLKPLITSHFPFSQYLEAYQFIEEQKDQVMKVMIDVDQ